MRTGSCLRRASSSCASEHLVLGGRDVVVADLADRDARALVEERRHRRERLVASPSFASRGFTLTVWYCSIDAAFARFHS